MPKRGHSRNNQSSDGLVSGHKAPWMAKKWALGGDGYGRSWQLPLDDWPPMPSLHHARNRVTKDQAKKMLHEEPLKDGCLRGAD
jgi:hypothetical protein